jgi:hypothetical protein
MTTTRNKRIRNILLALLVGAVTGICIGLYLYYKPQALTTSDDPDIEITASELYHAYTQNPDSAAANFKGKVILVRGNITLVSTDKGGNTNVSLDPGPDALAEVIGEFAPESKADLEGLKEGHSIGFKGTVSHQEDLMGIPGDVIIKHATLVK